jgi:hypothetical protein
LWRGFAVEPKDTGSCELFRKHLLENVCRSDGSLFRWVFGWFADCAWRNKGCLFARFVGALFALHVRGFA